MQITIYSPMAAEFKPAASPEWSGEIETSDLEEIFRLFNRVEPEDVDRLKAWGYELPSLSVGDLVTVDGKNYVVAPVGFRPADEATVAEIKSHPSMARHIARSFSR